MLILTTQVEQPVLETIPGENLSDFFRRFPAGIFDLGNLGYRKSITNMRSTPIKLRLISMHGV
jgi:hypothetical protein